MTEVIATVAITLSSAFLFAYWFRYTCLLILSAKTAHDYAFDVATERGLNFLGVQAQLTQTAAGELDRLRDLLDRDYALIARMLTEIRGSNVERGLETRMLAVDYGLARMWFAVSRRFSVSSARQALEEMSLVVAHFANSVGEAAAAPSAA